MEKFSSSKMSQMILSTHTLRRICPQASESQVQMLAITRWRNSWQISMFIKNGQIMMTGVTIQLGCMKISLKSFRNTWLTIRRTFLDRRQSKLAIRRIRMTQATRMFHSKRSSQRSKVRVLEHLQLGAKDKWQRLLHLQVEEWIFSPLTLHQHKLQLLALVASIYSNQLPTSKMMDLAILPNPLQRAQWIWQVRAHQMSISKRLIFKIYTKCTRLILIRQMISTQP